MEIKPVQLTIIVLLCILGFFGFVASFTNADETIINYYYSITNGTNLTLDYLTVINDIIVYGGTYNVTTYNVNITGDIDITGNLSGVDMIIPGLHDVPPAYVEGARFYLNGNTKKWCQFVYAPDVYACDGADWRRMVNKDSITIPACNAVIPAGSQGQRLGVLPACADCQNSSDVIGVTMHDCSAGDTCWVMFHGTVRDCDTTSWSVGDHLYLNNSEDGGLINTQLDLPNYNIHIGDVLTSEAEGDINVDIKQEWNQRPVFENFAVRNQSWFLGDINASSNVKIKGDLLVNTNTLFVNSTLGYVGIGTTSPKNPLYVTQALDANNRLVGFDSPQSATTAGGTYAVLSLANSKITNNNYVRIDFNDNTAGTAFSSIYSKLTNHSSFYGDVGIMTRGADGLVERLTVLSNGSVGIGTTSPSYILDIASSTTGQGIRYKQVTDNTMGGLVLENNAGNQAQVYISRSSAAADPNSLYIKTQLNRAIIFLDGTTENGRIQGTGEWGIGTANPIGKLSVNGTGQLSQFITTSSSSALTGDEAAVSVINLDQTTNNYGRIGFKDNTSGGTALIASIWGIFTDHNNDYGDLAFGTRSVSGHTEKLRITSAGLIGINISAPIHRLDVKQTTDTDTGGIGILNTGGTRYLKLWVDSSNKGHIDTGAGGVADLILNNGTGFVGIGTNNPSVKLDVNGSVRIVNDLMVNGGTFYVNSSSNRVGINTVTPTTKLEVNGSVKLGNSSGYTSFDSDGSLSFYGSARYNGRKYVANSVVLSSGTSSNTTADLQNFSDGRVYLITEAAATPGINLTVNFINVTAFNWVNIIACYSGTSTHAEAIQLYNWVSSSWDTFDKLIDSVYDISTPGLYLIGNHDFFVSSDDAYISSSGNVSLRFIHPMAGNPAHSSVIDVVALYQ